MATWEFTTPEPIAATIRSIPAGSVVLAALPTQTTRVTVTPDRARDWAGRLAEPAVEFADGQLSVSAPKLLAGLLGQGGSFDVTVELPAGSSARISTASADVRCTGELGSLTVSTASGQLQAERVTGPAEVKTASGSVRIEQAGTARVTTASGEVWLTRAAGEVSVKTASGDVRIEQACGERAEAMTASGDVRIAIPPGRDVYLDLSTVSGDVSSGLEPSGQPTGQVMTVQCRTVSGDISVSRASAPAIR
jgi:DUF4097 and DUF4098 domain-containing protein YvlB